MDYKRLIPIVMIFLSLPLLIRSAMLECINHGDVNLDGEITSEDAQAAFFIVLGYYTPTYAEACAADCDGDGQVTASDAQAIFLLVLGLGECVDPPPPGKLPSANMDFLYFRPDTYNRGSLPSEHCREPLGADETRHQVTFTLGYSVMTTEVTRQMWMDLKNIQPTLPDDPSDTGVSPTMDHPVQRITWFEALLFANLMSLSDGLTQCYYKDVNFTIPLDASNYATGTFYCNFDANGYRLPTEAEWEYAARAGKVSPFSNYEPDYSSANCDTCNPDPPLNVLSSVAWWCGNTENWPYGTAQPAGLLQPNDWGMYDMHGNVSEWCWDWYGYYPFTHATDPVGPAIGQYRVWRGGNWHSSAQLCRSAHRAYSIPGIRFSILGLRLVKTTDLTNLYSIDDIVGNMRFVPAGTFLQGSLPVEACRDSAEGPLFEHTLTRNIAVMETAITREMWANLRATQPDLPEDPSDTSKSPTLDHPVQQVLWQEAVLFANLLSVQNSLTPCYYKNAGYTIPVDVTNYDSGQIYCNFNANGYRLPFEGEREYFTRAGTLGPFSSHEPNYNQNTCATCTPNLSLDVLDSIAWWCGNSGSMTHPVGQKMPNPWGLYDVHGNVNEWCWDRFRWGWWYPTTPRTNYVGPAFGESRIIRGGSWRSTASGVRSASRGDMSTRYRLSWIGFRLVRKATE
jgi:formylglycine-generating enzyme required for sulfatase activity